MNPSVQTAKIDLTAVDPAPAQAPSTSPNTDAAVQPAVPKRCLASGEPVTTDAPTVEIPAVEIPAPEPESAPEEEVVPVADSSVEVQDQAPAEVTPESDQAELSAADEPAQVAIDDSPFARVPEALRPALEAKGFTQLTAVQEAALDAMQQQRDMQISSQTGSGKTVALGMVMAPDLIAALQDQTFNKNDRPGPDALVIAPTRELAAQVESELQWLFRGVRGLTLTVVTGGTSVAGERQRLKRSPRIVVGTPGRLLDHIRNKALDTSRVRHLVLDEADQMLDLGFRDELEAILEALPSEPGSRHTHMVSATFPPQVKKLTERYQNNPLHIEGTRLGVANADIEHVAHLVGSKDRYSALVNIMLLAGDQRSLVFVPTRNDASQVAEKLANDGFTALPLSGDLAQNQRTRTLNAFRNGSVRTIVATDVAARGIDVADIATVIHLGLPQDGEIYTHRSGRTGRAGNKGRSVLLTPASGARRARRMLQDARVEAEWAPVPTAAIVEKQLRKRDRRRLHKAIEAAEPSEAELEYAKRLLEEKDAAQIVAALIAVNKPEMACKPRQVSNPPLPNNSYDKRQGQRSMPQDRRSAPRDRDFGRGDSRRGFDRNQDRQPSWDRGQRPAPRYPQQADSRQGFDRRSSNFITFSVNWGLRSGANPRRLLALICRRGNVQSGAIGAIDMGHFDSTFEVDANAASRFQAAASRPDSRDPSLRITKGRKGGGDDRQRSQAS